MASIASIFPKSPMINKKDRNGLKGNQGRRNQTNQGGHFYALKSRQGLLKIYTFKRVKKKSPFHETSVLRRITTISLLIQQISVSDQNGSGIPPGIGNRALDNTKFCPSQADRQNLCGLRRGSEGVEFKQKHLQIVVRAIKRIQWQLVRSHTFLL